MSEGIYNPAEHRDSCGFGLIADTTGARSHELVRAGVEALVCMTHRGGINSDGVTGDGCGLLLQMPDAFMRELVREELGAELGALYAVGMLFLSRRRAEAERALIEQSCRAHGLEIIGWHRVPVNSDVLGLLAAQSRPQIEQLFIAAGDEWDRNSFARALFFARREAESALADSGSDCSIVSFSADTLLYKGLMMPTDIASYYPDLSDPRLVSGIAVFHQRFSTNTEPRWALAQPFRLLAHNGEINTIRGNRNWAQARAAKLVGEGLPDFRVLDSLVDTQGSDSYSLDNMLEVMLLGGLTLPQALRMLVPPAWEQAPGLDDRVRAFYQYSALQMEPWDGPAGIVLTDGRYAACLLDRNGLRPARYTQSRSGWIVLSSESGVCDIPPAEAVVKSRLGPGQLLIVDTETGEICDSSAIDRELGATHDYRRWLKRGTSIPVDCDEGDIVHCQVADEVALTQWQKRFQVSHEQYHQVLVPLAETGQEGTGAMGDDTPMAILSRQIRPLYDYFRQLFAQVTNPPIDSLRENIVMSLQTALGPQGNFLQQTPEQARRVLLDSPLLSPSALQALESGSLETVRLSLGYASDESLREALVQLVDEAIAAVHGGAGLLVLSERCASEQLLVHALLAVGAVHQGLVRADLRPDISIVVETGSAVDAHQLATLIGCGADAVYPWLAYALTLRMCRQHQLMCDPVDALRNYQRGICKALRKIMSKMGISTISSYRGAELFHIIGLAAEVTDYCFTPGLSVLGGAGFDVLDDQNRQLARLARSHRKPVAVGGVLKYIHGGEYHAFNPDVVQLLQQAVVSGDWADYERYADAVHQRPVAHLRDLLRPVPCGEPVPLDEVEPATALLKRFDSAGMSLGALSPEAHEVLAQAMNELGGRSNSGEGGEDPVRYGTMRTSRIKQIASGRFGVTPEYLRSAEVIQIKIAQGAKPGEGGQLPGGKVNGLIARLRHSTPGVTLISPPPHHDIYSIEDLAQLIFDLKQLNPDVLVSVKLVSSPGIGTIATGVAKAYADLITVSGYDGGTAASPLSSIQYAGSPWEIGLSDVRQALRANGMRHRVRVQVDGGLKTGRDVVMAALLGAESFGFGTAPMVAMGCKYLRICHLNNCATGVATQHQQLRDDHFIGTVQMVKHFFQFIAEHTRQMMASLGVRTFDDFIGRTDMLEVLEGQTASQRGLNLQPLLVQMGVHDGEARHCLVGANPPHDQGVLAEKMAAETREAIYSGEGGEFSYRLRNWNRSIGARLSGRIAVRYGDSGMPNPLRLRLQGVAGQSLGAWNIKGLEIRLQGEANDYVGKGMAGGCIAIFPPEGAAYVPEQSAIMGNTCLYGATGGELFAGGCAGERFAVRNSGARAVVEGVGDHCCEYMTGGLVLVLGRCGLNFGAGMTGGAAFVASDGEPLQQSPDVEVEPLDAGQETAAQRALQYLLQRHRQETGSARAQWALDAIAVGDCPFVLVRPWGVSAQQLQAYFNIGLGDDAMVMAAGAG